MLFLYLSTVLIIIPRDARLHRARSRSFLYVQCASLHADVLDERTPRTNLERNFLVPDRLDADAAPPASASLATGSESSESTCLEYYQDDSPFMVGSVVLETPRKQLVNAPLSSKPPPSRIENKVASLQVSVHPSFLDAFELCERVK